MRGVTVRVYEKGKRLALGAPATAVHWLGETALFSLGDGIVLRAAIDADDARTQVHDGAILSACVHPDKKRLVTAGDDGKLCVLGEDVETLLETRGKWIDHVVANAFTNIIVAAAGKEAIVLKAGKETHRFSHPTTIGGLALDGKGRRLAVSHYNGVTLRYALMADDKGVALNWAGSHLATTMSPDAEYILTGMQENSLHGWRMPDKTDIRMTGYAAKTKSFSWNKSARLLATSGADCAVVWPFVGKLGPQGKEPLLIGRREPLVTCVAFHPSEDILAIGYEDGAAVAIRIADQVIIELDETGEGPVTALAWSSDGMQVAIGDEAGRGAIVDLSA